MGKLLDDFAEFIDEEDEDEDYERVSLQNIKKAQDICTRRSYYGINPNNLLAQFKYNNTKLLPWKHVTMSLDTNNLVTISGDKLEEFRVFEFIEELDCIGENGIGFNNCNLNRLKVVTIPKQVLVINNSCFAFFKKLHTINFEDDSELLYIGNNVFAYCKELKVVDLSMCYKLEQLGKDMFIGSGVKTIKLNSNIKYIDNNTFRGSNIQEVYVDNYRYEMEEFMEKYNIQEG